MSYCAEHGIPHSKFLKWSTEDRSKTLAYVMENSLICQMCGTAEWQWEEDRFAFEPMAKRCHGCHAKDITAEETANLPGVSITLVPSDSITQDDRDLVRAYQEEAAQQGTF